MYMIYWTEESIPKSELFDTDKMTEALKFSEALRQRKYSGENVGFIVMSVEHPDCVGKQGFDVTGPDYDWKKRR